MLRLTVLLVLAAGAAGAATVDEALELAREVSAGAAAAQQRIDDLDDERRRLLAEAARLEADAAAAEVHNRRLRAALARQQEQIEALRGQLRDGVETRAGIVPLMLAMVDALERFVDADLPFLRDERRARIDALRADLRRAELTLGDKYRRLVDAYLAEIEYGHTLGVAWQQIDTDGGPRQVRVLRVGRTSLFALTPDRRSAAVYDAVARRWRSLGRGEVAAVRRALLVVAGETAPALLRLPLSAPGDPT